MNEVTEPKSLKAGISTQSQTSGIHILAEFHQCQENNVCMVDAEQLQHFCEKAVDESGLTRVGSLFYQFTGAGVTGTVLLAESHVAIHTWPENDYLSLDVFVCNVTQDNSKKARDLYQKFVDLFSPEQVNYQEADRS